MKETKYTVKYTTSFKKDYKRAIKRGLKIELLEQVVALLAMGEPLPDKNRDHDLSGDWAGHRECHILPDWLLIYRIEDDVLVLTLARTGTSWSSRALAIHPAKKDLPVPTSPNNSRPVLFLYASCYYIFAPWFMAASHRHGTSRSLGILYAF